MPALLLPIQQGQVLVLQRAGWAGDERALNKRIVQALASEMYDMELHGEANLRLWASRKAAWAIEDTEQELGLIYRAMVRKGLESIQNVGPKMAAVAEGLIKDLSGV